ncbi:MAG: phosphate acyltransferase PlsX [Bryobacteraceae bacterium]
MVTIAVDAMGGDHAPKPEIAGAIHAAKTLGVRVILVGREDVVRKELEKHKEASELPIDVIHASEVVTMDDSAAKAVRSKRDSSMRVASRLVRDGAAHGFVSAGNTGAVMATAKMVQGVVPGVDRPALAGLFPTAQGTPVAVVDVGANVDCTAHMLAQFAVMGETYMRAVFHLERPRVGLLSIGEEEHKGNELTRTAMPLMRSLPVNFIGNVEGGDIYSGKADVIVCDGFIGNVALKVSEGLVDIIKHMLHESLEATITSKIGALLSKAAFTDFKKRVDYSEYGGAPLLGVKGVCIICHGRSNANAIRNAIRVASESVRGRINQQIEDELREWTGTKRATQAAPAQ